MILRTSGGQTLPLMRSLRAAGVDAWSPARTIRRVLSRGRPGERRIEIDVPIIPTFVFAREADCDALAAIASDRDGGRASPHPAFSVFHHGGRVPFISDGSVRGLQDEEAREAATMAAIRAAETHEEGERIRIAAIKSEAERRRATKARERAKLAELRMQPLTLAPGAEVEVSEMPAMIGVAGVIEAIDGPFAWVVFGSQSWKIEGWRLLPSTSDTSALRGLAA